MTEPVAPIESHSLAFEDIGLCDGLVALREAGRWFVLLPFEHYERLVKQAERDDGLRFPITTLRLEQTIAVT